MYLIGNYKLWKTWGATGIELLVSPLSADDRDAILASLPIVETDDAANINTRFALYVEQAAQKCVHDWKNVGGIDASGKPVAVPCNAETIAEFMREPRAREFVQELVVGLGVRQAEAVEAAGNG